jgi:NAD(P)-dependent dehydrogenase (short-subunit alcohol dehydrogenase family)
VPSAIVTGSGGLIGSESVRPFVKDGSDVIGLERERTLEYNLESTLREIYERNVEYWTVRA